MLRLKQNKIDYDININKKAVLNSKLKVSLAMSLEFNIYIRYTDANWFAKEEDKGGKGRAKTKLKVSNVLCRPYV